MAFNIVLKESALKDLQQLSTNVAKTIFSKIENELPQSALQQKQLKGNFKGLRRMRAGDYRVIFEIRNEQVIVLQIMHRKDVYR